MVSIVMKLSSTGKESMMLPVNQCVMETNFQMLPPVIFLFHQTHIRSVEHYEVLIEKKKNIFEKHVFIRKSFKRHVKFYLIFKSSYGLWVKILE